MELVLKSRNLELGDPTREYIQRKLDRVENHLASPGEARVEISKEETRSPQDMYQVQIIVNSNSIILRAEEHQGDIRAAIDAAIHMLERQARRYKTKHYMKKRRDSRRLSDSEVAELLEEEELNPAKVVRRKRFEIQPMTVEQATERMELLDHDFFFFFNADTDRFAVVYRRNDGDYGLIEPDHA